MRPPPVNPRDLCCHGPTRAYAEIAPPPALRAAVAFFWTLSTDGSSHRITPDGAMDLMIDLDRRAAHVVGGRDRPLETRRTAPTRLWGVRFHPAGGRALLGVPPRALLNGDTPLDTLDGPLPRAIRARLDAEPDGALAASIEAVLAAHAAAARAPDACVTRAVDRLRSTSGALPVHALAEELGVGPRRLERLFVEHVGLVPKGLARLFRFGEAVRRARASEAPRWSAIACELGYADQAHLSREFSAFAAVPPSHLFKPRRAPAPTMRA